MSKRRKRNPGNPQRRPGQQRRSPEFDRPPTDDEAMDIAVKIYQFADLVADGKATEAVDSLCEWIPDGEVGHLHSWYLATLAPILAMGLIRKHFPVDMEPDDLWVLEHLDPDAVRDEIDADNKVHSDAMAQILVRHLNDDEATARDLTRAHVKTHGPEGLFRLGIEGILLVASVIKGARENPTDDEVASS